MCDLFRVCLLVTNEAHRKPNQLVFGVRSLDDLAPVMQPMPLTPSARLPKI
jgi:hypothetical protein